MIKRFFIIMFLIISFPVFTYGDQLWEKDPLAGEEWKKNEQTYYRTNKPIKNSNRWDKKKKNFLGNG